MSQLDALARTLALEIPVAVGLLAVTRWAPRSELLRAAGVSAAASLLTHPVAWTLFVWLGSSVEDYWVRAVPIELVLTGVEAALYARLLPLPWRRALAVSLLANGVSFGFGVVRQPWMAALGLG